ncbi:MAG: S8 family serine peptidase, partial [Akkermansiaceae bacterium]
PSATPLSVRIADDNGTSNTFLIAQGIIAAVDAGADIINISLGGSGQSSLVDQAIAYAKKSGVVIIAAAGNSGTAGVMQPAASPGVIAVGAVDANNQYMNFSTTGNEVAISSPGFGVNVAYPGDKAARVSGTSFSSPIVAGVFAAVASSSGNPTISPEQAASLVMSNLNDVGIAGTDPNTGGGVPDMGTIMNLGTDGRYDASINSIYQTNGNQLNILAQNLGTETIINSAVSININGRATQANITTLAPMQTHVITIPQMITDPIQVSGSIQLSSSQSDQRPQNNSISQQITPSP